MEYLLNLNAFFMPLSLFSFWGIVGYAALSLLRSQRNTIQNLLLAPTLGIALTLLPVFWLNRLGLPINHFAPTLLIILLSLSAIILWWRKPLFPIKNYLPFVAIFLLALLVTGRPLLLYGFDWVSYSNDDMANYCVGALRLLNHGFFEVPNGNELVQGKDYSLYYWFMHVPGMVRPGSEMLVAFFSSVTHLPPLQIFMPVILAFHLTLISITGAIMRTGKSKNKIALLTCLLLTFSALTSLGSLYQLIAQVGGLSLFIATILLALQPFSIHKKYGVLTQSLLIAIIASALLIVYPEMTPFLVFSTLLYFGIMLCKGWRFNQSVCLIFGCTLLFAIAFLGFQAVAVLQFILAQSTHATSGVKAQVAVFPYYLMPSGFANLWGLIPISVYPSEPFLSLKILMGVFLTLVALAATIRLAFFYAASYAVVAIVMMLAGILLFKNNLGFGLFKLSMFIQPFLFAIVAVTIFHVFKKQRGRRLAVVVLILLFLPTTHFYVTRSKSLTPGSFTEVLYASHTKINKEYLNLVEKTPKDAIVLSDDFNISLVKFQALQSNERVFLPLSSPKFFRGYVVNLEKVQDTLLASVFNKYAYINEANNIIENYISPQNHLSRFNLHDDQQSNLEFQQNDTCMNNQICLDKAVLISDSSLRGIVNRWHEKETKSSNFSLIKYSELKNHLIFTDSYEGAVYNATLFADLYKKPKLTFFALETDSIYRNKTMQAIGKQLLFRVVNPTPQFRVGISLSTTVKGDGINQLPPASIIGDSKASLPLVGRGSARVFSEPLTAQLVNNIPYIVIDMNIEGTQSLHKRMGLMRLYGQNISLDTRYIVAFARDVSIISEDEYQQLDAPTSISEFPQDLDNPNLEYSGIYEDGWISELSFVQLKQTKLDSHLTIHGMLPKIADNMIGSNLVVVLDGNVVLEKKLTPGPFEIVIPVKDEKIARRKIELRFSQLQALPRGDKRPVAAKIDYIGFV